MSPVEYLKIVFIFMLELRESFWKSVFFKILAKNVKTSSQFNDDDATYIWLIWFLCNVELYPWFSLLL